ncbi:metallophosphoesterase [Bradyrhizobium sp.]|jgi:3',5'-cyclic AMP phosphodiesterase CpdA|uniref:metallophosphoesterase family protein n=1 Tax=Bradyrhizobium sp. TaxID=376 RepID=UPI002DF79B8A|nr:metallophosphoesterase [Bradyrhizobium sp.]
MRTIAHISDLHFGRHNLDVMENLLASIEKSRPDLVVISGDFTQRARHVEFAEARRFLDRIAVPKLVTPGNHDVPLYNLFHRYLRPFRKYDRYIAPLDQPLGFFQDDGLAVLGLNTARRFTRKNGRLSQVQISSIRRIFASVPRGTTKIIVTHHPLAVPDSEDSLELAGRAIAALKAIADAGVHLLLSGHHHRALSGPVTEVSSAGSILIVHAGTAISTRTRGVGGNSYNLIQIAHGQISVRVMEWGKGQGFVEAGIASYAFDGNRWRAK